MHKKEEIRLYGHLQQQDAAHKLEIMISPFPLSLPHY